MGAYALKTGSHRKRFLDCGCSSATVATGLATHDHDHDLLYTNESTVEGEFMHEFTDLVAVITGAASGIGKGMAIQCAQEGMKLVL